MSKQCRAEPQGSGALQTQYVFARVFINKKNTNVLVNKKSLIQMPHRDIWRHFRMSPCDITQCSHARLAQNLKDACIH